ncbi:MAG: dihydropteroate synthase [Hydrogenophilales bacterium 28-61-23]|nr:MAG: dihydropteroate synthase [Hydrogenophilales bacterium 28-61-23]
MPNFLCGRFNFSLAQPLVMGIVNVTPDSFSDGGRFFSAERAIEHGLQLKADGANILDIGGESTRPGSAPVSIDEELARVMPVLEGLRGADVAISVDTMKPEVMAAVLRSGADMINDVQGFQAPGALDAVAGSNCGLCVMHMRGMPKSMQLDPSYEDVVIEVSAFLRQRLFAAQEAGVDPGRVLIDPGFGFGKAMEHNLALFKNLDRLTDIAPVLVGVSRKSFLGQLTGHGVTDRLLPGVVAALLAIQAGVAVVRVHDVRETVETIRLWRELRGQE